MILPKYHFFLINKKTKIVYFIKMGGLEWKSYTSIILGYTNTTISKHLLKSFKNQCNFKYASFFSF